MWKRYLKFNSLENDLFEFSCLSEKLLGSFEII